MKVLFVCRHNVGRSQMAKAFYNYMTGTLDARSAGTHVAEPGQTLLERKAASDSKHFFLLDVMDDVGIDISNYTRTQLTEFMAGEYDLIVSMATPEDTPAWLLKSPRYVYWDIKDPRGQDYAKTVKVRDQIKNKVAELIKYNQ